MPIYIRQEPGKSERIRSLDLWFSCSPQHVQGGHWAVQHYEAGPGLWFRERPIWINEGVSLPPTDATEQVQGSWQLGCTFSQKKPWFTPEGGAPQFVGETGFGWINTSIVKTPARGNASKIENWSVPCDGLVATVRVATKRLYPGAYLFNTNAVQVPWQRTLAYTFSESWGLIEVPLIHKYGWLIVKPPAHWPWQIDLGRIVPVDADGNPWRPDDDGQIPTPSN